MHAASLRSCIVRLYLALTSVVLADKAAAGEAAPLPVAAAPARVGPLAATAAAASPPSWTDTAKAAMAPPPPPEPLPPLQTQRDWAFFPGIYHRYGRTPVGGEVTMLYRGLGLAFGGEPGARYAEAELGLYFLAAGLGPRFTSEGTGMQWTVALPLLPVFPYMRTLAGHTDHRSEFGLMLKLPLYDFKRMQGVL